MEEKVKELFKTTDMTIQEIADYLDVSYTWIWKLIKKNFSEEERRDRKVLNYSSSKLGDKNPMNGKFREEHHNYIGEVSDGKGYIIVLKPEWYTGRKGSKHVFKHSVVMCEALGITEIPKGFMVHHIDKDPTNNNLNNLALVTSSGHQRIHSQERATTSLKA